nr:hypothetical protein Q903MT_gene2051 [Picea sitchensis]
MLGLSIKMKTEEGKFLSTSLYISPPTPSEYFTLPPHRFILGPFHLPCRACRDRGDYGYY